MILVEACSAAKVIVVSMRLVVSVDRFLHADGR